MEELKENEKRVYEQLKILSRDEKTIELSLRNLKVGIATKEWFYVLKERVASHMAIKEILKKLELKGYITVDRTDKKHTKITIL